MYARLVLLVLILIVPVSYSLQISEVMFNPSGSDSGREWVEVYNNDTESYNLTGWKLNTDSSDHSLNVPPANSGQGTVVISPGSFAVIAQDAASFLNDYSGFNGTVIDSSWSDLSNSVSKTVWIKNSTVIFDNVTYFLAAEGNSSCRINDTFISCIPAPGAANSNTNNTNASPNAADASLGIIDSALVNATYTLFKINLAGKDCARFDNVTIVYNVTPGFNSSLQAEISCNASIAGWTPLYSGNYTVCSSLINLTFTDTNLSNNEACKTIPVTEIQKQCNTSVAIAADSVFNAGSAMEYKLLLSDSMCNETSVDVEYWIEDLFGFYMKAKLNTTQEFSCSKSVDRQWTPDSIVGTEAYKIKAVLKTKCNDINNSDNSAEKLVVVKGSVAASSSNSSPSSSSSSSSVSSMNSNATVKPKTLEIISYNPKVYAGELFETVLNASVNASFSVYSYVYSGNTPISEWGGRRTWDANKQGFNATYGVIALAGRIENDTPAGNYTMKVKIKGEKDEEAARIIEVLEKPKIYIEKLNNTFNVSTSCTDCEILIIGEGFEKSVKDNYLLEEGGTFYVLLLKDSKIFSKQKVIVEKKPEQNKSLPVTGFMAKSAKKLDGKMNYVILLQVLSKMKVF